MDAYPQLTYYIEYIYIYAIVLLLSYAYDDEHNKKNKKNIVVALDLVLKSPDDCRGRHEIYSGSLGRSPKVT